MSAENKALMRRWYEEIWNQGNQDTLHELLAPHAMVHNLPAVPKDAPCGPAQFWPLVQTFRGAMPDLHIDVEDVIAEGDLVVARCTVRGTHQGDHLGFAPTQKPVTLTGISIARIHNGQLVEGWNNFDFLTMYQQLGTMPPAQ